MAEKLPMLDCEQLDLILRIGSTLLCQLGVVPARLSLLTVFSPHDVNKNFEASDLKTAGDLQIAPFMRGRFRRLNEHGVPSFKRSGGVQLWPSLGSR